MMMALIETPMIIPDLVELPVPVDIVLCSVIIVVKVICMSV